MRANSITVETVGELFDFCKNDKQNLHAYCILGVLSDAEIKRFNSIYQIDFSNYHRIIDSYAIKHILKNHGNIAKEEKRGQIAITKEYLEQIPQILAEIDNVIGDGTNKIGRLTLKYEKTEAVKFVIVEEIRTNYQLLALDTMRIYKTKAVIQ